MNYHISSSTIGNSLLVDLLKELTDCFKQARKDYIVIGAASRDILRLYLEAEPSPRRTRDLDRPPSMTRTPPWTRPSTSRQSTTPSAVLRPPVFPRSSSSTSMSTPPPVRSLGMSSCRVSWRKGWIQPGITVRG